MVAMGALGVLRPELVSVWGPVSAGLPGHGWLVPVISLISMAAGIGLLVRGLAVYAARLLFFALLLWLLAMRLPGFFRMPLFAACWSVVPLLLMVAAAWVLYVWLACDWDRSHLGFLPGERGLRIARILYGLCMIFFGVAHFMDVKDTVTLVPHWLPTPLFFAYFTGCTFVAAGLAAIFNVVARLAVTLSAAQIASFLLLVWVPIVAGGARGSFQWSETILNAALCAAAWVLADSFRISSPANRRL